VVLTARELTASDVQTWRRLRQEGTREFPLAFYPTYAEACAFDETVDASFLEDGGRFGVFDGTECVGIAAITQPSFSRAKHRAEIGAVYVRKRAHGTGAADELLHAMFAWATDRNVWQIELHVAAADPKAQRFYKRFGFREVGRIPSGIVTEQGAHDDLIYVLQTALTPNGLKDPSLA